MCIKNGTEYDIIKRADENYRIPKKIKTSR